MIVKALRLLALSLALLAGSGAFASPVRAQSQGLTVFAAASLTNALQDIGERYTKETGVPVRFSFASSSAVARQIEAGAPADVFVSADTEWADYLEKRGLLKDGTRRKIVANTLVLVAPGDSTAQVSLKPGVNLAKLLGPDGKLATGDPDFVPAGRYAKAALQSLGAWQSIESRVLRASNVRTALAFVARGEAPLGIVYGSDVVVENRVRIVGTFPTDSHPPIEYPAAVVKGAKPGADGFLDYLQSPAAAEIFRHYGFTPIPR
ncbi:MAG: molybdate ABC transporter substrate-binding protein [Alphaproteobacteria bacterium]|nr:molybdate ABC transporter substrate-binding protein [Alphaproteobacteria bacterium]